ncbi:MAG: hypothetical protein DYG89_53275 [Caldilinea sp. CFX5]|nr:hypothetical protein [Caldilinea sp. CFX5]
MNHTETHRTNAAGLGLRWIGANFVAVVLAIVAVLPLAVNLAYANQPAWLTGALVGAVLGLALGVAQWWVLRRPLSLSRWWIVNSLIGGALGLAIGMQLADALPVMPVTKPLARDTATLFATGTALQAASSGLLFGLLLGLLQWLVLRQRVHSAGWWIVANTIGWAAALGLAALWPAGGAIGWLLLAGTVNGVITGWLLQSWVNRDHRANSEA